jgi:flagellar hook assembly protein FlgD
LEKVYNFPNPFKDDTYFTFELRGYEEENAENVQIKVFTVAGRLIKDFTIQASELQPGFNRVYWDGKDQDGDLIANGLYFYKVIARLKGETKSVTQKLAKIK